MLLDPLEPRRLLAGVTILTHGYEGNVTGWIATAADDAVARLGGASAASEATLTVGLDSKDNLNVTSYALDRGYKAPSQTTTGELFVKLDWSSVSDGSQSTTDVGEIVANYLMNADVGGFKLASLPMHLVGHSRGASLVTVIAHDLGKAGVWVDQQTDLDSHPVDGKNDIFGANFGDSPMATYDNVAFADSYWRTDGDVNNLDFDGEPVAGAHNLDLNKIVQTDFVGSAHLSVPSYYNGTINLTSLDGGDTPIFSSWYGNGSDASKPSREQTGFDYSALIGGTRPSDGLWSASGGTGKRSSAGESGKQWANVSDVRILGGRTFAAGQSIKMRYIREDRDDNSTVAFFLDRDTNPLNNNSVRTLRQTNLGPVSSATANRAVGSTDGATAGTYWVQARITDRQGHVRFAYSKSFRLTGPATVQSFAEPAAPSTNAIGNAAVPLSRAIDTLA